MHLRRAVISTASALTLVAALVGPASAAHLTNLTGLTVNGALVQFSPATACTPSAPVKISGLADGETILAIDERPATGNLYGLGSTSRIYQINATTGAAIAVGSGPFTPALSGSAFGFDFNPVVDRIRIVSDTGQNLRVNPITGAVAAIDTSLAYAAADANAGAVPNVVGAAYTNPDKDPATGTTLYDIDAAFDRLVTQSPPNDGTLNTIGGTVKANDLTGFDISLAGDAFVAFKTTGSRAAGDCGQTTIATIDLGTGATIRTWSVGTRTPLRGIAVDLP